MKALASKIVQALEERPRQFSELVDLHREVPWREFLKAWGEVRAAQILKRDEDGQYLIERGSASERDRA